MFYKFIFPLFRFNLRFIKVRMNIKSLTLPILVSVFMFTGCILSTNGYKAPPAFLYQNTVMNKDQTLPGDIGFKTGKSCVTGYAWLVTLGNASVQAAAAAGGVITIKSVEYEIYSIGSGLYAKTCTIVHGD